MTPLDKLENNYRVDSETGCWIWTGYVRHGYGIMGIGGWGRMVHRVAYEELVAPIPKGMHCHHTPECGNKCCFNPAHIEILTKSEHHSRHSRGGHEFKGEIN